MSRDSSSLFRIPVFFEVLRKKLHPQFILLANFLTRFPKLRILLLRVYAKIFFGYKKSISLQKFVAVKVPDFAQPKKSFFNKDLIIVDCQSMQSSSLQRGIGRYSRSLIINLGAKYKNNNFLLIFNCGVTQEVINLVAAEIVQGSKNVRIYVASAFPSMDELTSKKETAVLSNELTSLNPKLIILLSVFESKIHVIPIELHKFSCSAVILYDVIPLQFPDLFLQNKFASQAYLQSLDYALTASHILAISKSSIEALKKFCPKIPPFTVIYGSGFLMGEPVLGNNLDRREGVLLIGSDSPHKNVQRAIEAYSFLNSEIRKSNPLHILGLSIHEKKRLLKRFNSEEKWLVFHESISDEELKALYSSVRVTIVPSLQEGLGMPVLEAWNFGCVVIGSANTSVHELLGSEKVIFDPYSTEYICRVLEIFLTDDTCWIDETERLMIRRGEFTWEKTAEYLAELLVDNG